MQRQFSTPRSNPLTNPIKPVRLVQLWFWSGIENCTAFGYLANFVSILHFISITNAKSERLKIKEKTGKDCTIRPFKWMSFIILKGLTFNLFLLSAHTTISQMRTFAFASSNELSEHCQNIWPVRNRQTTWYVLFNDWLRRKNTIQCAAMR